MFSKLKPCKVCNKEISKQAEVCPHCGQRYKAAKNQIAQYNGQVALGFIIFVILIVVFSGQ